jgi:hypothetical protein
MQNFESIFSEVMNMFNNKIHYPAFKEYLATAQDNGVAENARYFFFIARDKVLQSRELFREFYDHLEHKHASLLFQLYFGKRTKERRDMLTAANSATEAPPLYWWQKE